MFISTKLVKITDKRTYSHIIFIYAKARNLRLRVCDFWLLTYYGAPNRLLPALSAMCGQATLRCYANVMFSMRRRMVPRGILISTSSPTFLLSRPCAIGVVTEILPSRRLASLSLTMV